MRGRDAHCTRTSCRCTAVSRPPTPQAECGVRECRRRVQLLERRVWRASDAGATPQRAARDFSPMVNFSVHSRTVLACSRTIRTLAREGIFPTTSFSAHSRTVLVCSRTHFGAERDFPHNEL